MDILTIQGGKRLSGRIVISGSKNAALPILIATLLTDDECVITNVPLLADIETVVGLITFLGKTVEREKDQVIVRAGSTLSAEAPYELVRRMRASVLVMGPLLARLGQVKVSLPGGCAIGGRPINIHLDGFRSLGAQVELEQGYVKMTAPSLTGQEIHMDFASVGATENLLMAASLAKGKTIIHNAAMEPEITDLAHFLISMGAKIEGVGTAKLTITGVSSLHGCHHRVIPDRIEAGTFMIAAAMTHGELTLEKVEPSHLSSLTVKMRQSGIDVQDKGDQIIVRGGPTWTALDAETAVYPGFATDLQAQWMALMSLSSGVCGISEKVFENRFMHVPELQRMGADIQIRGNTATVVGVKSLSGADVMVSDLRAGAALVLGGLAANGKTTIHRIYHLDRGYEAIETKLRAVGATIERGQE